MGKFGDKLIEYGILSTVALGILIITPKFTNFLKRVHEYDVKINARKLPQTRNVIGDPNATDPNDTYITINGQNYYRVIDGKSVEDYFK